MAVKQCARCGTAIEVRGNRRFCEPCAVVHSREYSRKSAQRARMQSPEAGRERQRRYRDAHRDEIRERARVARASRAEYIAAWRDLARFGGAGMDVLERDGYRCRLCLARPEDGFRNLTIHHIDGSKTNNIVGNLITLCRVCHPTVHNRWNGALRQDELRALIADQEEAS